MRDLRPASRLRIERIKAGWGLTALADAVGKNRSSLYRIEVGRTQPKLKTRQKLAAVLKVKEADLFRKM